MTLTGIVLALRSVAGAPALSIGGGRIALVEIDGVIDDDRVVLEQLREYRRDASIKGYLVLINSPGGAVGPSQSIFSALRRIRDEDDVPVVASIAGVGASGGYHIAIAADSVFALPGSITGSIGVIMEIPEASELLDKVGVRWQTVQSAAHKDVGSPFRPLEPGDRAILDSLVMDVYAQFVDVVAEARSLDRATVERIADGRIVSGRQALALGLVDRLGNREDALATVGAMAGLGNDPRTVRPAAERPGLWDVFFGRGATRALARLAAPLEPATLRVRFVVPW